MIEQFINFVIRPPRAAYDPDQYLWEKDFTLAGRAYKREDLELQNRRGQTLRCSHYVPNNHSEDVALPCVIYCHGNSGCRADANEAAVVLLPANITVFTLDFSGSGLSDGNYVSLGWHEKDDLGTVVSYLRHNKRVSHIGLWGRSMGAVTGLLYGYKDPSIAGMVLDSAFSDLFELMMELVDVYKIRLPKFTVKVAVQYMRRVIQKRANFDIKDLNCKQVASETYIPSLFAHANEDKFIQAHHSDIIFKLYAGEKNIIKFDGDHNSARPQVYYDSVSVFFYNTLKPPQVSSVQSNKIEKCLMLNDLGVGGMDEEGICKEDLCPVNEPFQDTINGSVEECCSFTSSNRESWGRCSSIGASDAAEYTLASSVHQLISVTPVTSRSQDPQRSPETDAEMNTRKINSTTQKKPRHERLERLGAFGQRLRLSILTRVRHKRQA